MSKIWDLIKNEKVEWKKLGDVCSIERGIRIIKKELISNGIYPVISGGVEPMGYFNKSNRDANTITIAQYGSAGFVNWQSEKFWANDVCYSLLPNETIINKYLFYFLKSKQDYIYSISNKTAIPYSIDKESILNIEIPIPSIDTQNKIVKILDKFNIYVSELERELERRNKQYQHYRDYILNKYLFKLCKKNGTNIEKRKLCELLEYEQPGKYIVKKSKYSNKFNTPVLTPGKTFILGYTNEIEGIYKANKNNPVILFDDFTAAFKWVDFEFKIKSSATKIISPKININLKYCFYNMQMLNFVNEEHKRIWISEYSQIKINIPNITIQNKVVEILDNFFNSTNKIDEGLPKEIKLRKQQYEYYRNKLLDFSKN